MTTFPNPAYLSDALRTQAEMKNALEDFLAATRQLPGAGGMVSTLTIAAGSITPTTGRHIVDTEAAASTDDLATIAQTNIPDGGDLLLRIAAATRLIVVKHGAGGAGQVSLADAADLTLADPTMVLWLRRAGTLWEEVGRFYGNQARAARLRAGLSALPVAKGAALTASAGTLTVGADGDFFHVAGSVTVISALSTTGIPVGTRVTLVFDTAVTVQHSASLLLQSAVTRVTQAGDVLSATYEGSGVWRETGGGVRPSGVITDFDTSGTWTRPAGVTRVLISLVGGGGGGGTGTALPGAGGGGGAGETLWRVLMPVSSDLTITLGAGGAAQAAGTQTTVTGTGVSLVAAGGAPGAGGGGSRNGGTGGGTGGGAGGAGGTGADAAIPGSVGQGGTVLSQGGGGGGGGASNIGAGAAGGHGGLFTGGAGGGGTFSGGGGGGSMFATGAAGGANGVAGSAGSRGSGGGGGGASAAGVGGAGGAGFVRIEAL